AIAPDCRSTLFPYTTLFRSRLKQGLSICIFPEGGVPDSSILLDDFKDGAFRLAIDHQIPIVPITFYDNKKRFSYKFLSGSPGKRSEEHTSELQSRENLVCRL